MSGVKESNILRRENPIVEEKAFALPRSELQSLLLSPDGSCKPTLLPSTEFPLIHRIIRNEQAAIRELREEILGSQDASNPFELSNISASEKARAYAIQDELMNGLLNEVSALTDLIPLRERDRQVSFLADSQINISEYELFAKIARVYQSVAVFFDHINWNILEVRVVHSSACTMRLLGELSVPFSVVRSPPIGWSYRGLEGENKEAITSFLEDILSQRRFGYFEFLTGEFLAFGGVSKIRLPLMEEFHNYHRKFQLTGYEVLVALTQDKLPSSQAPSLVSAELKSTWERFHLERGLEFGEQQGLYIPFECSSTYWIEKTRNVSMPDSERKLRSHYGDILKGIRVCEQFLPDGISHCDALPLYDYLGRMLWSTVGEAKDECQRVLRENPYKEERKGHLKGSPVKRVRELEEKVGIDHPRNDLLKLRREPRRGEQVLKVPSADKVLEAEFVPASEFSSWNGVNAFDYYDYTSNATHELGCDVLTAIFPRNVPVNLKHLESVAIATSDGKILFENIEHLYSHYLAEEDWYKAQVLSLHWGMPKSNVPDIEPFLPKSAHTPHQEYLTYLHEGVGYVEREVASWMRPATDQSNGVMRGHIGLPLHIYRCEQEAREIKEVCGQNPALWPLFYSKKIDKTNSDDVIVVEGYVSNYQKIIAFRERTPEVIFREISDTLKSESFGFKEELVLKMIERKMQDAQELLQLSGLESIWEQFKRNGESFSTIPRFLRGKKIVDKEGNVVAENFGHYISQYLSLCDSVLDDGIQLGKLAQVGIDLVVLKSRLGYQSCFTDVLQLFKTESKKISIPTRLQLESLSERKVWERIHGRTLEVIDAFAILNEVCHQLFGVRSYFSQFDHLINDRFFTDKGSRFFVKGSELIQLVNNDSNNKLNHPTWRKRLPTKQEEVSHVPPEIAQLRRGLVNKNREAYLKICKKYPSLHPLFFPRKVSSFEDSIVGEVDSAAVFARLIDKSPEVASKEWRVNKPRLVRQEMGDLEAAKIHFVQEYINHQRDITDFFDRLNQTVLKHANISVQNWSTVPKEMEGLTIVDSDGYVFAENYGHFVTIKHDLYRFLIDRERELAKLIRVELIPEESMVEMAFGGFHEILWGAGTGESESPEPFLVPGGAPPSVTLRSLSQFSNDEHPHTVLSAVSEVEAEQILSEACTQLFGVKKYSPIYDAYLYLTSFCNPERTVGITGSVLLASSTGKIGRSEQPELTVREKKITEKQRREERKRSLYQEMFKNQDVPLGTLFFALCAIGGAAETRKGYRQFKQQVLPSLIPPSEDSQDRAKSDVSGEKRDESPGITSNLKGPVDALRQLLDVSEATLEKVDLSAIGRARLKNLLYQLCYRSYQGDTTRMLDELSGEQKRLSKDKNSKVIADVIIKEILPELLSQVKREKNFVVPKGIRFNPFGYQRSTVASVWEGISSLIVGSVGSGKTEMAALLFALQYKEEKKREIKRPMLLLTTPSNRHDTFKRIRNLITSPAFEITLEKIKKEPEKLSQAIQNGAALHCSYATLSALHINYPDIYKLLTGAALVIADEGQQLSNHKSKRYAAVRDLLAEKLVIMSATPAQHRIEDLASPLSLTRPDLFPNVDHLKSEFRRDKSLALALYHQNAVIVSLEDVAHVFKPFDTVSAREQLERGLPCIPALVEHEVSYQLSVEHTRRYVNFALGKEKKPKGASVHHKSAHLRRLANLRKLQNSPTTFGADPAFALLQAIKEIALPAMARGEKVVILGEHLAPLELLAQDPELKAFGATLLSGNSTDDERSDAVRAIVDDPNILCLLGQMQVLGVGHNLLGVEHVIFIEPPKTVSSLLQGIRHRRVITLDTIRYAKDKVHAWYVKADLDPDVVELIDDAPAKEILKRGSIYSVWFDRLLMRAKEYSELTNHPTLIKINEESKLKDVIENLIKQREELKQARAAFIELQEHKLKEIFFRYRCPAKTDWRENGVHSFVRLALPLLKKPSRYVKVAVLPGPEALEIPLYLEEGIVAKNILAFEAHPDEDVRRYCRTVVQKFGAQFFGTRMEHVLPRYEHEIDILSIDTNGYITPELVSLIASWNYPNSGILLKNALCGREQGSSLELLAAVDGDRKTLDRILLRIAGSQSKVGGAGKSPLELVKHALRMEAVSTDLAKKIAPTVGLSEELLVDLFTAIGLGGPLTKMVKIVEYSSENDSPFLSNFALLERLDPEASNSESICHLRSLLQGGADALASSGYSLSLEKLKKSNNCRVTLRNSVNGSKIKITITPQELTSLSERSFH